MHFPGLLAELKRRNVYRVAVAYALASWLIIQVATQVFPFFEIPAWAVRLVVVILLLGLPLALVFAWIFELTPQGLKRTEEVAPHESIVHRTGRQLDFFVIGILLVVIALLVSERTQFAKKRPAQAEPEQSVAVLPFDNLSEEKANAFFADGIQDDVLTSLAKVHDLKVISRTSVMGYRNPVVRDVRAIARALGVSNIVEGTVRRERSKVRVTAALVDARSERQLWAESYDRDLANVFSIQSDIAEQIVAQLKARLSPAEKAAIETAPTTSLAAYDLYVRGAQLTTEISFSGRAKENLFRAVALLNQAVDLDPDFFRAYTRLVYAHGLIYLFGFDHTPARLQSAAGAMREATRLRPDVGETHLARAGFRYRFYLDFNGALQELAAAQHTLPKSTEVFELRGYVERRQGHWEKSAVSLGKALELDPRNFFILQQIALSYQPLRRYAEMASALDRALLLAPLDTDTRVTRAAVDLEWRADPRPLHKTIHDLLASRPAAAADLADQWLTLALCERDSAAAKLALAAVPPDGIAVDAVNFSRAWCEGLVAYSFGEFAVARKSFITARAEAERKLQEQPEYAPTFCELGMIDAGLGRKEEAVREGRRACELLPVSKDAVNGAQMMKYLGVIYAWVGEKDRAVAQVRATLRIPGDLSYGQLRLHPFWDALRADPQFEALLLSIAPKRSAPVPLPPREGLQAGPGS